MPNVVFTISNGAVAGARFEAPSYVAQTNEYAYQASDSQSDLSVLLIVAAVSGSTVTVSANRYAACVALQATDADMPRCVEDLIDTAIAKGNYAAADLPATLQTRYTAKKAARAAYLVATG
jgi:hypothetical protein